MNPDRAQSDLRWFFDEGEGALGLHGQSYEPRGVARDGVEAARSHEAEVVRWAEVTRRLRALPEGEERVLRLAFTSRKWPGLEGLYELAGVMALLLERERLARPNGTLRVVALEDDDIDARRIVRSGSFEPLPNPDRHEDLVRAGRLAAGKKGEEAVALRDAAKAALKAALASYRGAVPRECAA
jgi:hypothetical protein